MKQEDYLRYQRAEKKMKSLKGFYGHLRVFFIVTVAIFIVRFLVLPSIGALPKEEGFVNWLDWNTYLIPGIWAIALVIHGIAVRGIKIQWIRNWEQRKIEEFMEQENNASSTDGINN